MISNRREESKRFIPTKVLYHGIPSSEPSALAPKPPFKGDISCVKWDFGAGLPSHKATTTPASRAVKITKPR
ncbi:hypothetical protein TWF970_007855 [Orbilia oligospora]|uniref:Uncharacterized protein n=1 Tax=Orbilia oligospora TaxID=2813651 RepID=A0A7C8V263_ORBOL|nr:hypothetical protein TWF970_007855 [Orbilia oligospora]